MVQFEVDDYIHPDHEAESKEAAKIGGLKLLDERFRQIEEAIAHNLELDNKTAEYSPYIKSFRSNLEPDCKNLAFNIERNKL